MRETNNNLHVDPVMIKKKEINMHNKLIFQHAHAYQLRHQINWEDKKLIQGNII